MNYDDCRKFCANFKPKQETPFPQGLRTADLEVGMVVTCGNRKNGFIYTILEKPGDKWLKVLSACPGFVPRETEISLADHSCQPYEDGTWNHTNWLRKVI